VLTVVAHSIAGELLPLSSVQAVFRSDCLLTYCEGTPLETLRGGQVEMDSWVVRVFESGFVKELAQDTGAGWGQVGQAPSSPVTRCGVGGSEALSSRWGRALKVGGRSGRI
jgi:hypothetical protein